MHWVIQENFKDEHNYDSLMATLDRQRVQHTTIKMIPFGNCTEPDLTLPNPVFVVGATSLKKVCQAKGWLPGYLDENLDYEILLKHYGDRMLNSGAIVSTFAKANPPWENFFCRPALDGKQFSGFYTSRVNFDEWRTRVLNLDRDNSYVSLSGEDRIVCAPWQGIYAEYRFFVIDGKVVTGSRYKRGGRVQYDAQVDEDIRQYAQATADIWCPNRAFALDIAMVEDGFRVIEINSINSSGFYACDMGKFVAAINAMEDV